MKNLQRGFVVPLLVGIIALLVIGGGVYVYKNNNVETPVDKTQPLSDNSTAKPDTTSQISIEDKKAVESPKKVVVPSVSTVKEISPNGGETLVIGKIYTIKWWDDSDAGNKTIFAINSLSPKTLIPILGSTFMRSSGIDGTYVYSWKVGSNITAGKYKVMVCKANTNDCATSDNYFNIVAETSSSPTITVLSPNGGELYKIGSDQIIKWNAPASVPTVRIFLESVATHYAGGGVGGYIPDVHKILAQDAANSGSFTVTIPSVSNGAYKILIEGIDNSVKPSVLSDASDGYINIVN